MMKISPALVAFLVLAGSAWSVSFRSFETNNRTPKQYHNLQILADSSHAYDVRHYRIDIDLPMTSGAFSAHEQVALISRIANMDTFSLNMDSLVCDSVKRGPTPMAFTTPIGWLQITLDRPFGIGESLDVDIFYHRSVGVENNGFQWYSPSQTGHHAEAFTYTVPTGASYWFPCWDQLWDKAERGCMINITVPDTFTACSNGWLDSVTTNSIAHTRTFWWNHHFTISAHSLAFAVSKYATWHQYYVRAPGDTVQIQYFIWPEDSVRSDTAFQDVLDIMSFYTQPNRFGPYIFEKYGIAALAPGGSFSLQTLTQLNRSIVDSTFVLSDIDEALAHELSHQWWACMVTIISWANVWLNEGFATYSEYLYMEHKMGHAYFLSDMASCASSFFYSDSVQRYPLYNPPFLWGISYTKGAWVQHMLRYVEGDTSATPGIFFTALRAYADSMGSANASTADYQRIHERVYGDTLNWFFYEWVYLAGYPQYTVNWFGEPESTAWRIKVDISQNNGSGAPPVFHMPVEILFHLAGKDTLVHYPITTSPQHNEFVVSAHPDSAVFDPGYWILKKVTMTNVGVEAADRKAVLTPFALGGAVRFGPR